MTSVDLAPAPITPRRTRLVRVPDLARLQQAIALTSIGASPFQARRTAVVVPSASAAQSASAGTQRTTRHRSSRV